MSMRRLVLVAGIIFALTGGTPAAVAAGLKLLQEDFVATHEPTNFPAITAQIARNQYLEMEISPQSGNITHPFHLASTTEWVRASSPAARLTTTLPLTSWEKTDLIERSLTNSPAADPLHLTVGAWDIQTYQLTPKR